MKNSIVKWFIPTLIILALASVAIMAAGRGDRGTILSVHSEGVTAKFKVALGLPKGQTEGGRYAVVQIDNGAYGDASFALVYVPPQITVYDDDLVELNTKGVSVLAHPGSAAVSRVINIRNVFFST
jgi:hypothetical protein